MINQTHYNRNIVLAIKTSAGHCHYLQLSPENYQGEFIDFVRHHELSKEQTMELKHLVEGAISQRAKEIRARFYEDEQRIKREQIQWMSQANQKLRPQYLNQTVNKEAQVQTEQLPTEKPKTQPLNFEKLQQTQNNNDEVDFFHSPRFKNLQEVENIDDIDLQNEQDLKPRESPKMTSPPANSTQANSPQGSKQEQITFIEPKTGINDGWSKRPILLENQMKKKSNQEGKKLNKELISLPKGNPEIYQRLYQKQTESFKSKRLQQVNTQEEEEFYKHVQPTLQKAPIGHGQDLSIKTTQSFRAKYTPQKNTKQESQIRQFKASFAQHLRIKQEQKAFKDKIRKIEEKLGKKIEIKGSHCQAKITRENLQKLKKEEQVKQQQILKRVRADRKANGPRDLSKRSRSPPPESRVCASCSPASKQKAQKASASVSKTKKQEKNGAIQSSPNKKYVSDILKESYLQFSREANQK